MSGRHDAHIHTEDDSTLAPTVDDTAAAASRGVSGRLLGRRVGWTLIDQVLFSGTNFLLGILVARSVSPVVFGAFSIAYATYILCQGLSRGVSSEPLVMRYSASAPDETRKAIRGAVHSSTAVALAFSALTVVAALVTVGPTSDGLWALAIVLPAVLVQDVVRFSFFTLGRPHLATLNDAIWGVTQIAAIAALVLAGRADTAPLMLAWGGSGAVSAVVGLRQLRVLPGVRHAWRWMVQHRDLGPLLALEFLLISGPSQVTLYVLGFATSLAQVAALRAGQVLIGPVNVLFRAARVSMVAEGVRLSARSLAHLRRGTRMTSMAMGVAGLAWGIVLVLLPDSIGRELLADQWASAKTLLPLLGLDAAARGAQSGATAGLRALGYAKDILSARGLLAPAALVSGFVGALWFGALGAAAGLAITATLAAILYWRLFVKNTASIEASRLATPEA